jgi:hypothetical protein
MLAKLRPRLTYANVVSTACLFIVLGGTAVAAGGINSIGGLQIRPNAVGESEIKKNAVGAAEVKKNAIGASELKKAAVGAAELKQSAVTSDKIKDGALQLKDIAQGQIPSGPQGQKGSEGDVGPTAGAANSDGTDVGSLNVNSGVSTTVNVPVTSRLFIQGIVSYFANCGAGNTGPMSIGLVLDGVYVSGSRRDVTVLQNLNSQGGELSTIAVVPNVSAGNHTVRVTSALGNCAGSTGAFSKVGAIALGG